MLALGENWYLNMLLNSLEKLNIFIENNKKYPVQKSIFSSKVGLTKIKEVSPDSYLSVLKEIDSNSLTTTQVKQISENLTVLIQDQADE